MKLYEVRDEAYREKEDIGSCVPSLWNVTFRPGFETELSSAHLTKVVPSHNQNTTVTQNVIHPLPVSKSFRILIKITFPMSHSRPVEFISLRLVLRNQHFHKQLWCSWLIRRFIPRTALGNSIKLKDHDYFTYLLFQGDTIFFFQL